MAGVNKVILIGYLGKDPELKYGQASGKAVCRFSLATTEKWGGEDKMEWHNIVCFDRSAEVANEYLTKGKQVCIEGRIQTRKWEDKNGNERYTTEIMASTLTMLGGGKSAESSAESRKGNDSRQTQAKPEARKNKTLYEDEFGPAPPMGDDCPF